MVNIMVNIVVNMVFFRNKIMLAVTKSNKHVWLTNISLFGCNNYVQLYYTDDWLY